QEAARLEASESLASVPPPVWRYLLDRLLWCDQFCASGVPAGAKASWELVAKELKDINKTVKAFAALRLPAWANAPADQAISFAIADRLAAIDSKNGLSKPLTDIVQEYDRLLAQKSPVTFK